MTIYNLYIFNTSGACIYYAEWNRKKQSGMSKEEHIFDHLKARRRTLKSILLWGLIVAWEMKLMYGLIFSIKSFVLKLSPTDCKEGFLNYQTSKYKLNFYETGSGLKFIMNTDVGATNVRDLLQKIYKEIYVEYVVKNPECKLGKEIISEVFQSRLDKFVRSSPIFAVRGT